MIQVQMFFRDDDYLLQGFLGFVCEHRISAKLAQERSVRSGSIEIDVSRGRGDS